MKIFLSRSGIIAITMLILCGYSLADNHVNVSSFKIFDSQKHFGNLKPAVVVLREEIDNLKLQIKTLIEELEKKREVSAGNVPPAYRPAKWIDREGQEWIYNKEKDSYQIGVQNAE